MGRRACGQEPSVVWGWASPLLRKYPKVKVVWSEGGIGWIPVAIERADRQ